MLAFRKVLVTVLLACIFVVGPFLAVAAGISLVSSLSPAFAERLDKMVKGSTETKSASVKPPSDRQSMSSRQQLDLLGTTLALLKPVPVLVPAGESPVGYAFDAIAWQFDNNVCNKVVSTRELTLGMTVAECDSGEKFLVIATSVSGKRSVVRCNALPHELVDVAPGCR
jgi:hypothetical protein